LFVAGGAVMLRAVRLDRLVGARLALRFRRRSSSSGRRIL
jgi:hypothetical protein